MINQKKIIRSAITAFLAISSVSVYAEGDTAAQSTEKCYGVAKAGMNDCATATASCAGSATSDKQSDAFILIPKGLCQRLVGGSLTIEKPQS